MNKSLQDWSISEPAESVSRVSNEFLSALTRLTQMQRDSARNRPTGLILRAAVGGGSRYFLSDPGTISGT